MASLFQRVQCAVHSDMILQFTYVKNSRLRRQCQTEWCMGSGGGANRAGSAAGNPPPQIELVSRENGGKNNIEIGKDMGMRARKLCWCDMLK